MNLKIAMTNMHLHCFHFSSRRSTPLTSVSTVCWWFFFPASLVSLTLAVRLFFLLPLFRFCWSSKNTVWIFTFHVRSECTFIFIFMYSCLLAFFSRFFLFSTLLIFSFISLCTHRVRFDADRMYTAAATSQRHNVVVAVVVCRQLEFALRRLLWRTWKKRRKKLHGKSHDAMHMMPVVLMQCGWSEMLCHRRVEKTRTRVAQKNNNSNSLTAQCTRTEQKRQNYLPCRRCLFSILWSFFNSVYFLRSLGRSVGRCASTRRVYLPKHFEHDTEKNATTKRKSKQTNIFILCTSMCNVGCDETFALCCFCSLSVCECVPFFYVIDRDSKRTSRRWQKPMNEHRTNCSVA